MRGREAQTRRLMSTTELKPCWWCGDIANTREHRFKSSDLKRQIRHGQIEGQGGGLILFGDGGWKAVQGPKSDKVKFPKNLCSECNNSRSQPFDRAYEQFTDYAWLSYRELEGSANIDFKEIYGRQWRVGRADLARYIIKYFCCRLDADGRQIPAQMTSFLNGSRYMPNVEMALYFDDLILSNKRSLVGESEELMLLWHSDTIAFLDESTGEAASIYGESTIGYVGFLFGWNPEVRRAQPFYRYRRPALTQRSRLPVRELRDGAAPIFRFQL